MADLLRRESVTGWADYAAELRGVNNDEVTSLRGLVVTGRCGAIDNTKSVQVRKPATSGPGEHDAWIGLFFDPATWDGSDIFIPKDSPYIVVDARVREIFEQALITNVVFVPLPEIERLRSEL